MANEWLKARQTKYAVYVATYIVVVAVVLVVANILAERYSKSLDATSNKRYSLSEQTAKIVRGLKQDATITYYDQASRFRTAKDVLDEYANASRKLHVEYVDPDKNPQRAREADNIVRNQSGRWGLDVIWHDDSRKRIQAAGSLTASLMTLSSAGPCMRAISS